MAAIAFVLVYCIFSCSRAARQDLLSATLVLSWWKAAGGGGYEDLVGMEEKVDLDLSYFRSGELGRLEITNRGEYLSQQHILRYGGTYLVVVALVLLHW